MRSNDMLLTRRRWLGALAATAAATPLLPSLHATADAADTPCRLVVLWQPNGTTLGEYVPQGSVDDFTLGRYLAPFEVAVPSGQGGTLNLRDHITVFSGHHIHAEAPAALTDAHAERAGCGLTGRPLDDQSGYDGPGISIDQHVAAAIGGETPVRSMQLSPVFAGAGKARGICFEGKNQPLPFRSDPQSVFDDFFTDLGENEDPDDAARIARRRSAVDVALQELDALKGHLGSHDREKMERHIDSMEGLLDLLEFECAPPDISVGEPEDCSSTDKPGCIGYRVNGERMRNIMVAALSCRLTNIVTYSFGEAGAHYAWPWHYGPIQGDNHSAGHLILSAYPDAGAEKHMQAQEYQAQWVGDFVAALAAIPEGEGTMLDNTLVLWQNELGDHSAGHAEGDAGLVLLGGAGVGLPPQPGGRWITLPGRRQNDVHATVATLLGVPTDTFGDPSWFSGLVDELL